MRVKSEHAVLLVIDFQEKLMPAIARHEEILERAVMLIRGMRVLGVPVMLTQQYTKGLGATLPEICEAAGSTDYFEKRDFSCCGAGELMAALEATGRKQVIVIGVEAHVCVLQTCLDLIDAGYQVMLAVDCTGSRKESDKNTGIQRATMEGVSVTTAESLLFELTKSSTHPSFKEISALVKSDGVSKKGMYHLSDSEINALIGGNRSAIPDNDPESDVPLLTPDDVAALAAAFHVRGNA